MNIKRSFPSKCAKPLLWSGCTVLVLLGFHVTLLARPQVLFSNSTRIGTVTVFYDGLDAEHARRLATEIDRRLRGSRYYDATRNDRVFVFRDRSTYRLYRMLTLSAIVPSGFNLSIFGNSYVCKAVATELGEATGGQPRFSIWDGDLAHVAAHEIGHQYIVDRIGSRRWRAMPQWKREGLPEYIADIGAVRADPSLSLVSRIGILGDDTQWTATPAGRRPGWDRMHYEAELMVEFLLDVQGVPLERVVSDRVTKSDTYSAMMSWASVQRTQLGGSCRHLRGGPARAPRSNPPSAYSTARPSTHGVHRSTERSRICRVSYGPVEVGKGTRHRDLATD